jgi:hypothetical protein
MTVGEVLVAAGTFLLALFGAWSAIEAMRAVRESRELDGMNVRRAEYRRSREIRGVARLIHQEAVINERLAREAIQESEWGLWNRTIYVAWDRAAPLIMEEVSEDIAAELVAFFSRVREWEARMTYERETPPSVHSIGILSGYAMEVLTDISNRGPRCIAAMLALAYPDAREVPSDPDLERAYWESHRARRWWLLRLR